MNMEVVTEELQHLRPPLLVQPCLSLPRLARRDNTEKIWVHCFFAKQKTDVPKALKMAAGGLGSGVSPQ